MFVKVFKPSVSWRIKNLKIESQPRSKVASIFVGFEFNKFSKGVFKNSCVVGKEAKATLPRKPLKDDLHNRFLLIGHKVFPLTRQL